MNAPAPPPPMPTPGTLEWVEWHLANSLTPNTGAEVRRLVELGKTKGSKWAARAEYARSVFTMRWEGWEAKLVWLLVDSSLTITLKDDDIPF